MGPKRTGFALSVVYPVSGGGFLLVLSVLAFLSLVRFTAWLLRDTTMGISTASVVVFGLLAVAYMARYLLVAVESSAEGYDLAPMPPDPREVEEVFGGLLKLLAALFFCLLPLVLAQLFGADLGPIPYILIGVGALYLPMAFLGMAVEGCLTGCLPPKVLPGVFATPIRYMSAAIPAAGAGWMLYFSWAGPMARSPVILLVIMDLAASVSIVIMAHRVGVVYRESMLLKSMIKPPEQMRLSDMEEAGPTKRMTELERMLARREKELREGPRAQARAQILEDDDPAA